MAPTLYKDSHPTGNWGHRQLNHDTGLAWIPSAPTKAIVAPRPGQIRFGNNSAHVPHTENTSRQRLDSESSNLRNVFIASFSRRADLKPGSDSVITAMPDSLPYTPPTVPHPTVPLPVSAPPPRSHPVTVTKMGFVITGVLCGVMVGLAVVAILISIKRKCKISTLSRLAAGSWRVPRTISDRLLIKSHGGEYDDAKWGTPTRVRGEKHSIRDDVQTCRQDTEAGVDFCLKPPVSDFPSHASSNLGLSQRGSVSQFVTTAPKPRTGDNFPVNRPSIAARTATKEKLEERLEDEEGDIALALDFALGDHSSSDNMCTSSSCPAIGFEGDYDIATTLSLQAAMTSIERRIHNFGVTNRARQGSDASASSKATNTTEDMEGFTSGNSPRSSRTSFATMETDLDEDWEDEEEVYEVRRAQTQSLEMKKGILVAWQSPNPREADEKVVETPELVLSEPTRHSHAPDDHSGTVMFSGTSSVLLYTGERRVADLRHVAVPTLIVTRPSTASVLTLEPSISCVTVDLNDFPHPPPLIEPYMVKLICDGNRKWDSSTIISKRTTVEQFIMMYGNV